MQLNLSHHRFNWACVRIYRVGTQEKPFVFQWTPDDSTPDVVYYQCAVHQKLGWEIRVLDADAPQIESASETMDSASNPKQDSTNEPSGCSLMVGDKVQAYGACFPVSGVGTDFNVAWNWTTPLGPDSNGSAVVIRMSATASAEDQYVALAIPEEPGTMIGSSAIILSACSSCPTGASIQQFFLGGKSTAEVTPGGNLNVTDMEAFLDKPTNKLFGSFRVHLEDIEFPFNPFGNDTAAAEENGGQRRRHLQGRYLLQSATPDSLPTNAEEFPLLYASGRVVSPGMLAQHDSYGFNSINLTDALVGTGTSATAVSSVSVNETARTAHMWLMAIGWGFFIPFGIFLARYKPTAYFGHKRLWYHFHRVFQVLGFGMGIAGVVCGFIASNGWDTPYSIHRDIGITVTVLGGVQVLSLIYHPSPGAQYRSLWSLSHKWLGRAVAILAVANIYYGIIHVADLGTWAWATYTAVLGAIVGVAMAMEICRFCCPTVGLPESMESKPSKEMALMEHEEEVSGISMNSVKQTQ